jgi:hypothetical protein
VEGIEVGMIGHATWFMWNDIDVRFLWLSNLRPNQGRSHAPGTQSDCHLS